MHRQIQIICTLFCLLCTYPLYAQRILIHPEKVEIKPPLAYRTDNALKVWGGISAGPDADDIIVFSDGTLNTSAAIPDGSITFAKWASNSCSNNDIPKWNGSAWACAADATGTGGSLSLDDGTEGSPSLNFTADTNTGMWRVGADTLGWSTGGDRKLTLDSSGRLGIGQDSPSALLHISAAASQAVVKLNGGSNTWDLISLSSSDRFTIGDTDAGTAVVQMDADQFSINAAPGSYTFEVTGTANVTGTIGFGNVRNSVVPNAGSLNLGSISSPWSRLYADQLVNVLFVEEVAQLFGGYQVVGKAVGSIAATVAPADTTIDFGETITPPQWVLIRAKDLSDTAKTEYIRVVSLSSGTTYNVERDKTSLHGATPPNWGIGTPWLLLGGQGDGRIELYANSGIPRISFFTNELAASSGSNDPSDQLEWIRIGDLSNIQTTGTTPVSTYNGKVGFFAGSGSNYIAFSVNGSGSGAALSIGGDGSGLTAINGGNISTGTITAGAIGANQITASKLEANLTISNTIQTAASCGTAATACVKLTSTGLQSYNSTPTLQAQILSSTGEITAGGGDVTLDKDGIRIARNTTTTFGLSKAYSFNFATGAGGYGGVHLYNPNNGNQQVFVESSCSGCGTNAGKVVLRALDGLNGSSLTLGTGSAGDIDITAGDVTTISGTQLNVDTSGGMSISSQPRLKWYRNSNQTISNANLTDISFSTSAWSSGSWGTVDSTPSVPTDGGYLVVCSATFVNNSNGIRKVVLKKGSTELARSEATPGGTFDYVTVQATALIPASASDTFSCAVYQNTGGNLDVYGSGEDNTNLMITKVW